VPLSVRCSGKGASGTSKNRSVQRSERLAQTSGLFSFHLLRHKKYAMTAKTTTSTSRICCVALMAVALMETPRNICTTHPQPAPN
jgi:hypothetical protein